VAQGHYGGDLSLSAVRQVMKPAFAS